eukprot:m.24229 g.24229  ORF g.24229 m.24229 type:complete len:310 (+) comp6045_c0_seq1:114-1043(+)
MPHPARLQQVLQALTPLSSVEKGNESEASKSMRPVDIVATGRGGCVSRAPAVSTAMGSAPTDKSQLELLSAWYCPYAQRAWLALEEKSGGVEGVYTLTNAQDIAEDEITYIKSPALLAANPKGLVPTVVDRRFGKERIVHESLVCVEYIDEAVSGRSLFPGTAADRARARIWINWADKVVIPQFYRMLVRKEPSERADAAAKLLAGIRTLAAQIAGPFFLGESFSAVDIAVAPWLVCRMCILQHYRGFCVPETSEYAAFHAWAAAVAARPSITGTIPTLERLIWAYKRYADGTAKSMVADAIRSSTPIT